MSGAAGSFFVALTVAVVAVAVLVPATYWIGRNRLARERNEVAGAWATVEAELQRRHQLVPPLVEAVRSAAAHEQQLLTAAVTAAQRASGVRDAHAATAAEDAVAGAIAAVVALREQHPELDAQQNFLRLQEELTITEDRIAAARRYYNTVVRDYNTACHDPRTRWVARRGGFADAEYFDA